jgi:hypothetical protein
VASGPDTGANAETMPRRSRAERRREGLLPAGEDPVLRRFPGGPPRQAPATPPGGGRRRSDQSGARDLPAAPVAGPGAPTTARPAVARPPGPDWDTSRDPGMAPGSVAPSPRMHDSGPQPAVRAAGAFRPTQTPQTARDRSAPATSDAPVRTPQPGPSTPSLDARSWSPATSFAPLAGQPSSPATSFAPLAGPPSAPLTSLARVAGPPSAPLTSLAPVAGPSSGPVTAFDPISAPAVSPRTGERPTPGPARRSADGVRSGPLPAQPAARAAAPARPADRWNDAPPPVAGPASGPVGGRAAARLERQAAEAAARKSGRRGNVAAGAPPAPPRRAPAVERDAEPAGAPRRTVQFALAMVVVALVVLGVWTFTSPRAQEASSGSQAGTAEQVTPTEPSAGAPAAPSAEVAPSVPAAPPVPARAPVTVLNSTSVTGLAASIAEQIGAGGWETLEPGEYPGTDVAITTVYYTEGDAVQQAAAGQLVAQFPDIIGPAVRFFEVPGVADPGLVVIATGNWQP